MALAIAVQTPYPGLRPFREDEADCFFGQDVPLTDLRDRLYAEHFVAILGLSGCGKSSLLKAGLLAEIRPKRIRGPRSRWLIGYMRPGGDPLQNLVSAVLEVNSQIRAQAARLGEDLSAVPATDTTGAFLLDGHGLARYGHEAPLAPGQDILIVVDQFEELFRYQRDSATHTGKDRAALFVQLLLEAVRDKESRISVVITMRSEFLGDCALFFGLAEQVNQGTFLLPRMTRDQIQEVITGPAEMGGFDIDPSVTQHLLNETERQDDGLPLLQHALRRIHRNWQLRGSHGPISVEDLSSFETTPPEGALLIKHHLDDHLDSIYKSFSDDEKLAAKLVFRLLSERDSRGRVTRRPLPFPDIVKYTGKNREDSLKSVIEAFRDEEKGRTFLTPGWPDPFETEVIDISHECLLRRWDRLKKWIVYEQRDADLFRRLAEDTDDAEIQARESGQAPKPLEGTTLENLLKWWHESRLVSPEWALRYEGEFCAALGRPRLSFAAAQRYLDWSAQQAKARADKAKAYEEARIRAEERARQAEIESALASERTNKAKIQAELANERQQVSRQYALIVVLVLLVVLAVVSLWAFQRESSLRARADQAEKKSLAERAQTDQERARIAEQHATEEKANADEQKRLKGIQESVSARLEDSLRQLNVIRRELEGRNANLDEANKNLATTSSNLTIGNASLEQSNGNLKTQTDLAEARRMAAEDEKDKTAAALKSADEIRMEFENWERWRASLVVAGERFSDSYSVKSNRRASVLSTVDALEQATEKMGRDAQIKELYNVRKAGLNALGDAIIPELVVTGLQTGPSEAACYAGDTLTVFSLLRTGGLRHSGGQPAKPTDVGTDLFVGSRHGGTGFFDSVLGGFMHIYRSPYYLRRDDLSNARDLSDNCRIAAIGSMNGVIDQYNLTIPSRRRSGYFFPSDATHEHGKVEMVRVSPDGKHLIASFAGHGWVARALEPERLIPGDDKATAVSAAFSPDGRWLLVSESNGATSRFDLNASPLSGSKTKTGCCMTSSKLRQQSDVANDGSVAWFEEGSSEFEHISTPSARRVFILKDRSALRAVRISPDGTLIAAGRVDGSVDVWPAEKPNERPTHLPDQLTPASPVTALSWDPSGRFLTVLHDNGTVRVWRVQDAPGEAKAKQILDLLSQIDKEGQKDAPGDTRVLAKAVRERLGNESAKR